MNSSPATVCTSSAEMVIGRGFISNTLATAATGRVGRTAAIYKQSRHIEHSNTRRAAASRAETEPYEVKVDPPICEITIVTKVYLAGLPGDGFDGDSRCGACANPLLFGTHLLRRTHAPLIHRTTGNLRAVQILLGHTKIESTVRYLGIEVDDALAIAEQIDI